MPCCETIECQTYECKNVLNFTQKECCICLDLNPLCPLCQKRKVEARKLVPKPKNGNEIDSMFCNVCSESIDITNLVNHIELNHKNIEDMVKVFFTESSVETRLKIDNLTKK